MTHKRLTLFAGHYGSGKTNIALNYARWLRRKGEAVTVADLDIVNPYFRTKDSEEDLKKMNTTKAAMIELYDNMTKIKNYYTGKVFFHQVYFELERKYFGSQVMNALEDDAQLLADSVDDVLLFVEAISSDDIENLLQAKVR